MVGFFFEDLVYYPHMKGIAMDIRLEHVTKYYYDQGKSTKGIEDVSLEFDSDSSFVVITGESGSGKSTLIRILTGLDDFDEGEIYFDDVPLSGMSDEEREDLYRKNISFVFQDYNLIESLSAKENIVLALLKQGMEKKQAVKLAVEKLEKVGLKKQTNTLSSKLSGGERQRVAIARSLALNTKVIIFDEPTGNLDPDTSKLILDLINEIKENRLIVYVTHEYGYVSELVTRHIILSDGHVIADKNVRTPEGNKEETNEASKESKVKFGSYLYAANRFSLRRKGRFLATTIVLALSALSMLGISYSITNTLLSSGDIDTTNTENSDEVLTSPLGNEVLVKNKDVSKEVDFLQGGNSSDYFLDYGDLFENYQKFYLVSKDANSSRDSLSYAPFAPTDVKLLKKYNEVADANIELVNLYLPSKKTSESDYTSYIKYDFENTGLSSETLYISDYYATDSTELSNYANQFALPKVRLGSVYLYYTSDMNYSGTRYLAGSSALTGRVYDSLKMKLNYVVENYDSTLSKQASSYYNPITSSDTLTISYGDKTYLSQEFYNDVDPKVVKLPESLNGKTLSEIKVNASGTVLPLDKITDSSHIEYIEPEKGERFIISQNLLWKALMDQKGLLRVYAKDSRSASELSKKLNASGLVNAAYFALPEYTNGSKRIIDLKNTSVLVKLLVMLQLVAYIGIGYAIIIVSRSILSKFYYRKDYDQMVLGWIGYSFKDMLKINAISFVSESAILSLLTYVLMIIFMPDIKWVFIAFPWIILLGFLLNLVFSFVLSMPSRKTRRTML